MEEWYAKTKRRSQEVGASDGRSHTQRYPTTRIPKGTSRSLCEIQSLLTRSLFVGSIFPANERDPNTSNVRGTIKVNFDYQVIDRNAHSIDAHLTGHLLEFIQVVRRAYTRALAIESVKLQILAGLEDEIVDLMERHTKHRYQEVSLPPELRRLKR